MTTEIWNRARVEMARMTKPREIEGVLDTYLIRPLGFVFVQLFRNTRVTPNMLSVASAVVGVGIGLAFFLWPADPRGAWLACALMLLHSGLDAADGQLARVTGKGSPMGRFVDGLCDNVVFVAIYASLVLSYRGPHPYLVLLIAAAAGASHSTHCALVEFERMLFLNFVLGTHDTVAEQPEAINQKLASPLPWHRRVLLRLALNYSVQQRTFLRSSDQLERQWAEVMERRPDLRSWFGLRYRKAVTGMLRIWPILGPNSHKVALIVVGFSAAYWPSRLGMLPYLLYDLVALNLVMAVLIVIQAGIDRRLGIELEASAPVRKDAAV
jgi:phosphatidylglycerophosphate synthase